MSEQDLLHIAAQQQGFFRADQALAAGLTRRQLMWATEKGRITNSQYGLYRFSHFPTTPLDELYEMQALAPQGTFSHDTALQLFDLSEVSPRTIHFSIPSKSGFKPRPGTTIHHTNLAANERQLREGLWLTSPLRTLLDCWRIGVDPGQLLLSARNALARGLLGPSELAGLRTRYPYSLLSQ